ASRQSDRRGDRAVARASQVGSQGHALSPQGPDQTIRRRFCPLGFQAMNGARNKLAILSVAVLIGAMITAALFLEPRPPEPRRSGPPEQSEPEPESGSKRDILKRCLQPGDNKPECARYLNLIVGDVRFGTSVKEPFCLPDRELGDQEADLVFRRFWTDNPHLE